MVITKKASKTQKFFFSQILFFGIAFAFLLFDLNSRSIISSHVVTESSIILAKYFRFSQLHASGFRI